MTASEFRDLSPWERVHLRLERYCDGNWAAKNPGLRGLLTVAQAMRMRRLCDGQAPEGRL